MTTASDPRNRNQWETTVREVLDYVEFRRSNMLVKQLATTVELGVREGRLESEAGRLRFLRDGLQGYTYWKMHVRAGDVACA